MVVTTDLIILFFAFERISNRYEAFLTCCLYPFEQFADGTVPEDRLVIRVVVHCRMEFVDQTEGINNGNGDEHYKNILFLAFHSDEHK